MAELLIPEGVRPDEVDEYRSLMARKAQLEAEVAINTARLESIRVALIFHRYLNERSR